MKAKIQAGVKTRFSKYGLKPATITELVNIVEAKVSTMGTIEDDKLEGIISAEIASVEPFITLIQKEVDSRVQTPPLQHTLVAPDLSELKNEILGLVDPLKNEIQSLKGQLTAQQSQAEKDSRLATLKEALKAKGATKEPVLQLVLSEAKFDATKTNESLIDEILPAYDAKMKVFYADSFVPRVPEEGKSKKVEEARSRADKIVAETASKLGILKPEPKV